MEHFDIHPVMASEIPEAARFLENQIQKLLPEWANNDSLSIERRLRWLLLDNPFATAGSPYGYCVRDGSGGIRGVTMYFPSPFLVGDRRVMGLGACDFFVEPQARTMGFYLFKKYLSCQGFSFFFSNTCNADSARLWETLGGCAIPNSQTEYILPLRLRTLIPALMAGKTSSRVALGTAEVFGRCGDRMRRVPGRRPTGLTVEPCRDWQKLSQLFHRHRSADSITTDRSPELLEWRYGQNADAYPSGVYLIRDSRGNEGWFSLGTMMRGRSGRITASVLLDAVWPRERIDFREIFAEAVHLVAGRSDVLVLPPRPWADYSICSRWVMRRRPAWGGFAITRSGLTAAALDLSWADGDIALPMSPVLRSEPAKGVARSMASGGLSSGMALDELRDAVCRTEREIANGPIVPRVMPGEIRRHLASHYSFQEPMPLNDVVADVERMLRSWNVQVTHPRYFGLFNPSVTFASVIGDTLVAMYNPQLASWRTSPGANEIEQHTLGWLRQKFGFPAAALANFTSGGAEANLSAVAVALTRAFPCYGEGGLRQTAAQPTIYLTQEAHHSFEKIAHLTGLGRRALRRVAIGRDLKMDLGDLARRVAEDRRAGLAPFMVIGTAGTTGAGVIDPLRELACFSRSEDLWFHVDGAWGGAAILSPRLRAHLEGIEAADSITCDAHKWFSVPVGAGMFFCRHPDAVRAAFQAETSYMPGTMAGSVIDPYTTSVQWSRRFIGLKLFLALAQHGESGYIDMIEHQVRMGDVLRQALTNAGWRVVNATPLPVVCFWREGLAPASLLAALYERQIAWISQVRLGDGDPVLRACITSFRTNERDIEWVVREMSRLAANGGRVDS